MTPIRRESEVALLQTSWPRGRVHRSRRQPIALHQCQKRGPVAESQELGGLRLVVVRLLEGLLEGLKLDLLH